MAENKVLESRGLHSFERIGRPIIMYDQRSKYNSNLDEFNSIMTERKKLGRSSLTVEQFGPVTFEEE